MIIPKKIKIKSPKKDEEKEKNYLLLSKLAKDEE